MVRRFREANIHRSAKKSVTVPPRKVLGGEKISGNGTEVVCCQDPQPRVQYWALVGTKIDKEEDVIINSPQTEASTFVPPIAAA